MTDLDFLSRTFAQCIAVVGSLDTPCWEWTGKGKIKARNGNEYAACTIRTNKVPRQVTRHSEVMRRLGHDTTGKEVHHVCENTLCLNPTHLQVMTYSDHHKLKWRNQFTSSEVAA